MIKEEYYKMAHLEYSHWWFVAKEHLVLNFLSKLYKDNVYKRPWKILDLGCGTGKMLEAMQVFGNVTGIDNSIEALNYCRKKGLNAIRGDMNEMRFEDREFDLVVCLDVIEHIPDDEKVLSECYRVCRENGHLFVTVPAYQFLWSSHDIACHHIRRYSKKELISKIKNAGFEIVGSSYFYFSIFIIFLLSRLFKKISVQEQITASDLDCLPPPWLNKLLTFCLKTELRFLKYFNLPFGSSVFCLAKKNKKER